MVAEVKKVPTGMLRENSYRDIRVFDNRAYFLVKRDWITMFYGNQLLEKSHNYNYYN